MDFRERRKNSCRLQKKITNVSTSFHSLHFRRLRCVKQTWFSALLSRSRGNSQCGSVLTIINHSLSSGVDPAKPKLTVVQPGLDYSVLSNYGHITKLPVV
ncbi:hypothetical protein ILYODFUR_030838 [Ilyodon furcidens]|uniref:Uncharacterized protein n=1 Tax=Ilyodon furcidens TaxID=33524 RepID=A0ABV0TCF6_9TELE